MKLAELKRLSQEIEKERQIVKQILSGKRSIKKGLDIKLALMIVESPVKAKTIANFFGKATKRQIGDSMAYEVALQDKILIITASLGHILNLVRKEAFWGVKVDNEIIPIYDFIKNCFHNNDLIQVIDDIEKCGFVKIDKKNLYKSIKKITYEVDEIYLALDPDTEGEKIAFDFFLLLKAFTDKIFRIEYHEVTQKAILEALSNPRQINFNWVKAQITRRILDRWVGFALSLKLQEYLKEKNLSAGRVQTPVLGWIISRAEQAKQKKLKVFVEFVNLKQEKDLANGIIYKNKLSFEIENLDLKFSSSGKVKLEFEENQIIEKKALAPFTTDTLLQEANQRLGFSADFTMKLAQDLFENGLITYHRTDSIHISSKGINIAKEYLKKKNLENIFEARSWGKAGTHEAIRPTKAYDKNEYLELLNLGELDLFLSQNHWKLYDLIFRRFMTCQSRTYKIQETKIKLFFKDSNFETKLSLPTKLIEMGWNIFFPQEIYSFDKKDYEVNIFTKKVPKVYPYTDGSLIQEMKNKGIGRPSTYAIIVSTLKKRKYVFETPKMKFLYPTKKGKIVYEFLASKYYDLVNEKLTQELEKVMDEIQAGKLDYQSFLKKVNAQINFIINKIL